MAREIKYFSGGVTATTSTIYTVPAGRNAKIIFNSITLGGNGSYVQVDNTNVLVASYSGSISTSNFSPTTNTTNSTAAPGVNQAVAGVSAGTFLMYTRIWYVGAGRTVTVYDTGSGSTYSFAVIEEY